MKLKRTVLNYRVIVEPDSYSNSQKGYMAYCPTLGVADDGLTVQEAIDNVREAIRLYVDTLVEDGESLPSDNAITSALINTEVTVNKPVLVS